MSEPRVPVSAAPACPLAPLGVGTVTSVLLRRGVRGKIAADLKKSKEKKTQKKEEKKGEGREERRGGGGGGGGGGGLGEGSGGSVMDPDATLVT